MRNCMDGQSNVEGAIRAYIKAVKDKSFAVPEHHL